MGPGRVGLSGRGFDLDSGYIITSIFSVGKLKFLQHMERHNPIHRKKSSTKWSADVCSTNYCFEIAESSMLKTKETLFFDRTVRKAEFLHF